MSTGVQLAAVILTYNEERHIVECVQSVAFCDAVVVVDTDSTDRTVELAEANGAQVIEAAFENFAQIRNVALERVEAEWVLFVDADERIPPALAGEIRAALRDPQADGYWIPRHNYLFGRLTLGAGWFPDYQMRLVRRTRTHYERPVHEYAVIDGETTHLQNPMIHYNYDTLAQFQAKQAKYIEHDIDVLLEEGVRAKFYTPLKQALQHFWWRFVTLKGYRDGLHGLRLSAMMARYEYEKYARLRARVPA